MSPLLHSNWMYKLLGWFVLSAAIDYSEWTEGALSHCVNHRNWCLWCGQLRVFELITQFSVTKIIYFTYPYTFTLHLAIHGVLLKVLLFHLFPLLVTEEKRNWPKHFQKLAEMQTDKRKQGIILGVCFCFQTMTFLILALEPVNLLSPSLIICS